MGRNLKILLPFVTAVIVLIVAVLISYIASRYYLTLIAMCAIWACLALSWGILARTGLFSIGSQILMGSGAYCLYLAYELTRINPIYLLPVSGVAGAIASIVFWPAILRRISFAYFAIYSLIAGLIFEYYVKQVFPLGFYAGLLVDRAILFIVTMVATAVTLAFIYLFMKTNTFLKFVAIGQNQVAAEACGLSLFKYRMLSLLISGFVAGLAGGLLIMHINNFNAEFFFGLGPVIQMQIACLLGGLGTFWGPIIGGAFINILALKLGELFTGLSQAIIGITLVVLIVWLPRGLGGLLIESIFKRVK